MKYWQLQQIYLCDEECLEIKEDTKFRVGDPVEFQIIRPLGEGASCLTYYAQNAAGNMVVIKEFCPVEFRRYAIREEDGSLRMEFPQGMFARHLKKRYLEQKLAFQNEWLMQRWLQKRNLISGTNNPELYIGGSEKIPYLAMNCDGEAMCLEDMREFQKKCAEKNLDYVSMILRVLRSYAAEISQLHEQGMLLMDIKPGNMLIASWNQELMFRRIIDYGSVRFLEEIRESLQPRLSYTAEFASPEIKEKEDSKIGYASDIFSFGLTVIQFLTGRVIEADDLHLLYLSDERLKRNLLRMADETGFTAIREKDDQFFHLLNLFISYTLSEEIEPENVRGFDIENVGAISASQCRRRLRRMEDVIRLLTLLIGDSEFQYKELNFSDAFQRVQAQGDRFAEAFYGPEAEKEFGKQLFSTALLPRFSQYGASNAQATDILRVSESEEHGYLEAESGSGKTSAMKYAYVSCLKSEKKRRVLPVWLPMGQLLSESEQREDSLVRSYICRALFGNAESEVQRERHFEQLKRWMHAEELPFRMVLFCDGMNEAGWQKQYGQIKSELLMLMEQKNVTVILSGQNQHREFAEYRGKVWQIEPLQKAEVLDYFDEKLPVWREDKAVREKIEEMTDTLTTPCLLHYFCIPFLGLAHIPVASIPNNETQIMEQYLCKMDYCVQNKIHTYVAEYPEQRRPGFGAHLLTQVTGFVCWQMASHGEMQTTAELWNYAIERSMWNAEHGIPMIENMPVREDVYREKIQSLGWTSYLFERHDSRFYMIHESYRDFLAAKYLAERIMSETEILDELWGEIPVKVMKHLSQMVSKAQILRLRKRFLKKRGTYLWRQVKREFVNEDMLSEFFERDDERAGENLHKMIQMCEDISSLEKIWLCLRLPKDILMESGEKETDALDASAQLDHLFQQAAGWMQRRGLPGASAEQAVLVLLGSGSVYPEWSWEDKVRKLSQMVFVPEEELMVPMRELYTVLEQSVEDERFAAMRSCAAARLVLQEMEEYSQSGKIYERLYTPFEEDLLKQISLAAGRTFFNSDFSFRPELALKWMEARKDVLYESCGKQTSFDWNLEQYFAQSGELTPRDVEEMRRQTGTLCLLKQFVLLEHEVYHTTVRVIRADVMTAFAQLYLMLHCAVYGNNPGEMESMAFEKRIRHADCSKCKERSDLHHAALLLGCFGDTTVGEFFKVMVYRISHYKFLRLDRLKRKVRLLLCILAVWMMLGLFFSPQLIPCVAGLVVLGIGLKILVKDGGMIARFFGHKIAGIFEK